MGNKIPLKSPMLIIFILQVICLWSCAPSAPSPPSAADEIKTKEVSAFFVELRLSIRNNDADYLYHALSCESRDWIEDIRAAADTEPLRFLRNRPFHETLFILGLRMERRYNPTFDENPANIIRKTIIETYAVKKNFIKVKTGPFRVYGDRAEAGLDEAPNTPVFFFVKERDNWKIDLEKTLPLILKGAESMAMKKRSETVNQAIYLLQKLTGKDFYPDDVWD